MKLLLMSILFTSITVESIEYGHENIIPNDDVSKEDSKGVNYKKLMTFTYQQLKDEVENEKMKEYILLRKYSLVILVTFSFICDCV